MLQGQVNLRDAVRRQIDFESGGKQYKLSPKPAVLIVRYPHFGMQTSICGTLTASADPVAGIWTSLA